MTSNFAKQIASIEAGFRKPSCSITIDPVKAAEQLANRFTKDQLDTLYQELATYL